jgi:CHASE3 domain sensor protein
MQTWNEYISARPDLQTLVAETRALMLGHPDLADYEEAKANIAKLQAAKREWEAAR